MFPGANSEDRLDFDFPFSDQPTVFDLRLTDPVNHPKHYTQGPIETIDYMESALSEEELCGGYKMNVLKYVSRERHKNGLEDLKKAKWYLDRLISYLEKKKATR